MIMESENVSLMTMQVRSDSDTASDTKKQKEGKQQDMKSPTEDLVHNGCINLPVSMEASSQFCILSFTPKVHCC